MSFHLYKINEIYSNADGSVQFIEMAVGPFDGESFWSGESITVTQGATKHTFSFPSDLPSESTANTKVLIATQGFADLGLVAPDFIVPSGFLFTDGGTVDYAGVDAVNYGQLPSDGSTSVDRNGNTATATPTDFAGDTATLAAHVGHPPADFNGDGHGDVLFAGPSGTAGLSFDCEWQMADRSIGGQGGVDLFPTDFSVQVTGDFNGDGKADVLFENPTTGGVWEWQLDGTAIASQGAVDVGDTSFHILGTADFNGDGKDDLLWRSDTGFVYQWQMNGTIDTPTAVGGLDPSWHVVGSGDFNGDGKADILLRNIGATSDNGAFYLWEMNGASIVGQGGIERPDTSWVTLGTGDFDGDGKTDIAVRNSADGAVWIYLMNGTSIASQGAAGIADPGTWHVQAITDLNGDGKDDVLFRNDAGYFYSWDMNGTAIQSEGLAGTEAGNQADPSLHVVTQHWDLV